MDASARLGLPYLVAGQMQKHVTVNEALTLSGSGVFNALIKKISISY